MASADARPDEGKLRAPRAGCKSASRASLAAQRRRDNALAAQKSRKRDALAMARAVAVAASERTDGASEVACASAGGDDDGWTRLGGGEGAAERRAASGTASARDDVVTQPEWMWDDAPRDLREKWFVKPRPRGSRCLVVAARGRTTARSARDGSTLSTFQSGLPGGSARTTRGRGGDCFCILDCIFTGDERARKEAGNVNAPSSTTPSGAYHVLDIVAWNGASMYDCDAEFRFFWARTRLVEECDACEAPNPACGRDFSFVPTPWYECNAEGISQAYAESVSRAHGVEIDGLLFYHREAAYETGATPLVLLWRDAKTSAFFDRDEGAASVLSRTGVQLPADASRAQIISLTKSMNGLFFITGDNQPIAIAASSAVRPASERVDPPARLECGRQGRFLVGPAGIDVDIDTAVVRSADLLYLGPKPLARSKKNDAPIRSADRADALSKILFNARARTSPLTIERLIEVASSDSMDDA